MSIKLIIERTKTQIELQRGAPTNINKGDIMHVTLKGEKEERTYAVFSVEHVIDFNLAHSTSNTMVRLEEVEDPVSESDPKGAV